MTDARGGRQRAVWWLPILSLRPVGYSSFDLWRQDEALKLAFTTYISLLITIHFCPRLFIKQYRLNSNGCKLLLFASRLTGFQHEDSRKPTRTLRRSFAKRLNTWPTIILTASVKPPAPCFFPSFVGQRDSLIYENSLQERSIVGFSRHSLDV